MLELGVFGGKYMTDCREEFPRLVRAREALAPRRNDPSLNFFGVDASLPLSEWRRSGWIHDDDPRGWFQWYCRYYLGRRLPGRGRAADRPLEGHANATSPRCAATACRATSTCRPRQRQALLHWAYDPRDI